MQTRRLLLAMLLCMLWLTGFAQNAIKGTVKDKTGEPLIGVSVTYGNGQGTVTDINGNFSVNAPAGSTIKFSYVGYKPQSAKGSGNMTITLEEDNTTLDDVVVIGYGTVKKRDLTGAVASVGADALKANPVSNVAEALQGKLAGVNVISQDGRPGATISIKVRGGGSISQSNEPLYVVDGFPVSDLSDIPADQIVSIDVLKDAASTAIYGARGGNGVILVTTKAAADASKLSVSYEGYFQVKWAAKKFDVLNAQDYVKNVWSYANALQINHEGVAKYFGLGSANGNHYAEYANASSHDYTDDLLQTATGWNHNLAIQGGNEKTKYTFSANYVNDKGIKVNSKFQRLSLNLKLRQELAKRLYFDLDARYAQMDVEGMEPRNSSRGSILSSAFEIRPIDNPLGTDDITLLGLGEAWVNAAATPDKINEAIYNDFLRDRLRANFALSWEPIKGLTLRTEMGVGRNWSRSKRYDDGSIPSNNITNNFVKGHKYAQLSRSEGTNWRSVSTINYQVQGLGEDHSLSFLLGNEEIYSKNESTTLYGGGYPMDAAWTMDRVFGLMHNGDAETYPAENKYENKYNTPETTSSWFGRVNYSWKGRYLLTGTLRADGSSKFGPNNRWGYFPAAAAAWRISDEPFMTPANSWLDNLKLRVSYGTSGNDNISSSLWHETWVSSTAVINGKSVKTFAPSGLKENPDLKWETNISRNIGIDFGFFNRINGTLDFYWNTTKDLLMRTEIDSSSGYSYQYQNIGKTSNKGIELALNAAIVRTKDFNLNMNLTYNYNKNKVDELDGGRDIQYGSNWGSSALMPGNDYLIREGEPLGLIRGYTSNGVYTLDDFNFVNGQYVLKEGVPDLASSVITNYYKGPEWDAAIPQGQSAFPGAIKLKDISGPDGTPDGIVNSDDVDIIGRVQPHHTGGFGFSGNYKDFDFSANFTYQLDGKVYNASSMCQYAGGKETGLAKNHRDFIAESYQLYDVVNGELVAATDPTMFAALNAGKSRPVPFYEASVVLSEFVESAAYLRLSNITLGYTLPKAWTRKAYIQSARIYVTGGNLFCLTGYSGLDPDVNVDTAMNSNYPTLGMDYGAYHRARTFTVGLNVKF